MTLTSRRQITVRASKTDAGVRKIDMLPALRDELLALKAAASSSRTIPCSRRDGPAGREQHPPSCPRAGGQARERAAGEAGRFRCPSG